MHFLMKSHYRSLLTAVHSSLVAIATLLVLLISFRDIAEIEEYMNSCILKTIIEVEWIQFVR